MIERQNRNSERLIQNQLEDSNVAEIVPLPTPREVKELFPLQRPELVVNTRQSIKNILYGKDPRKLVIAGPCSIHDPNAALDYAERLLEIQDKNPEVLILMRAYFEKPRTTVGWKGLIHDPHLNESEDVEHGLSLARETLVRINALGLPCATEILDPNTPQYLADGLSYGTIGARTVESQIHRQLASGMSMPIGMKNGTSGDISVALNAIQTARASHSFPGTNHEGRLSTVRTLGNWGAHLVLRGGTSGPNYDQGTIEDTRIKLAEQFGLTNGILIDASHGNSNKDHNNQPLVAMEITRQIRDGQQGILGIMLESNINEGNQPWSPDGNLAYGVSITDACIDLPTTARVISAFARTIKT